MQYLRLFEINLFFTLDFMWVIITTNILPFATLCPPHFCHSKPAWIQRSVTQSNYYALASAAALRFLGHHFWLIFCLAKDFQTLLSCCHHKLIPKKIIMKETDAKDNHDTNNTQSSWITENSAYFHCVVFIVGNAIFFKTKCNI